jgi:hypothetical protein
MIAPEAMPQHTEVHRDVYSSHEVPKASDPPRTPLPVHTTSHASHEDRVNRGCDGAGH